jgi:hypothetical protein
MKKWMVVAALAQALRRAIHDGDLLTRSLTAMGFATSVHPDWAARSPLHRAKPAIQEQTI